MRVVVRAAVLAAGLGPLAGCSPPAAPSPPAQASGEIFDATVLHEVEVVMDPSDWSTLRENFQSDQYYAADVAIDHEAVPQIGVRSRGGATRSETKPSLQLKFHEYVKTRRFHGLRGVAIKNLLDDPSFLREFLSMTTYQAMGVAAPAVSFARVTVNGEYFGLYNLIENVDESFLGSRFGESAGYLYDYEYPGPWDFSSRGESPGSYVPSPFEPETHEDEPNPTGLLALVRAINSIPDKPWTETMSVYLDQTQFVTFMAVENALTAGDGVVGVFGVNNFSLYQYAGQSRFVFIPWDRGATFQAVEWPLFYRLDQTILTRRLLADPESVQIYLGALRRTASECLNEGMLGERLERAYDLMREAALTDTKKPYTNEEFETGVAQVRAIVARRGAEVVRQVDALEAGAASLHPAGKP